MSAQRFARSGFLHLVGLHPYRFAVGAFLLLLNVVSGISSSVVCHSALGLGKLCLRYPTSLFPGLWYALCAAVAWQMLLTCAIFKGKQERGWLLLGYAAFVLDGFTYGFSLSELLFAYGQPRALLLLFLAAGCGLGCTVIRLYCFIAEDGGETTQPRSWRRYLPAGKGLAFFIAVQGLLMPLCLYRPI